MSYAQLFAARLIAAYYSAKQAITQQATALEQKIIAVHPEYIIDSLSKWVYQADCMIDGRVVSNPASLMHH